MSDEKKKRIEKEKNGKSKQNKLKGLMMILPIVIGAIGGVALGNLATQTSQTGKWANMIIINYPIILISMLVSFFFHIVTHEAGHLVCGLLSGYKFVSFRIGSFTLVHTNKKWKVKRFNIPGTGGQCLMEPPEKDKEGYFPVRLYNFGGIIVNFLFSLLFTILAFLGSNVTFICVMGTSAFMGWITFLSNGIPMKVGGISNDGHNVRSMDKDPVAKECFYIQLDVNARLSKGQRMKDIPLEYVQLEEEQDISNPLITAIKVLEYYWYAEQRMFTQAQVILEQLKEEEEKTLPYLKNFIIIERLYDEILHENRQEVIDELLTNEFKVFLKKAKYDVHVRRIQYGLELRKDANSEATKKAKQQLEKVVRSYPVEGEANMSLDLATYLEEQLVKENH